jgi:hypothetical protein
MWPFQGPCLKEEGRVSRITKDSHFFLLPTVAFKERLSLLQRNLKEILLVLSCVRWAVNEDGN